MVLLEFKNVSFAYGRQEVLSSLSFSLAEGECLRLEGPNGSGKSTAMAIAAGALKAQGGQVLRSGSFGYAPQSSVLFDDLTVKENLAFFARLAGAEMPEGFPLPIEAYLRKRVRSLSGGMKKAVSLCCAFLGEPQLLILDEPAAALDAEVKAMLEAYLLTRLSSGTALLLSGHADDDLHLPGMRTAGVKKA